MAMANTKAMQHPDPNATSTIDHTSPAQPEQKIKGGSIQNARRGIAERRKLELSSLRAYDELMLPIAIATQRAPPSRGTYAKQTQQETSWPKRLKAKASARTLKSTSSLASLTRRATSQSSAGSLSPLSPAQSSPMLEETPPPVPPIPLRFVTGSPEPSSEESPKGETIAPFLAYEQLAPTKRTPTTPTTPTSFRKMRSATLGSTTTLPPATPTSSAKMRSARALASTTTVNSTATVPSFPSIPEDPVWDEAVARVRERVRREQEEERREQKASSKAERRVIRNISKGREGHFKWAKLAIEGLIGKYDEHGWLPKKDPKDFDDDDWEFVLEVLNHQDTKKLRDRLFKKPEWIEADKARKLRYEEAMRVNPTPEYLAAQKAQKAKERKEYGFRKILGMLTEEELERERLGDLPQVGLGISNVLEPTTPSTVHTAKSSKATGQSSQSSGTHQTLSRGRKRADQATPGSASLARRSVEQMTGVFNIDSFDPRLSRLGSDEIKQYIREKSATRSEPQTPTPIRFRGIASLDPRQSTQGASTQDNSPEPTDAQTLHPPKKPNVLSKKRGPANSRMPQFDHLSPPIDPPTAAHPALRNSRIPRLRHAKSSITPSRSQGEKGVGETRLPMPIAPPRTQPRLPRDRPPEPSKPSSAVKVPSAKKASSEPASFSSFTRQVLPPPFDLSQGKPPTRAAKTAPLIRKPSTAVKTTRSISGPANPTGSVLQQASPATITFNADPAQPHQTGSPQNNAASKTGGKHTDLGNSEWRRNTFRHAANDNFESAKDIQDTSKCVDERRTSSLPLFEPGPKSLARLSRVPAFPDASDFLAAMGEGMPHGASSNSIAPLTPRNRLTAKGFGNPVVVIQSSQPANYRTDVDNYFTGSPTVSLPTTQISPALEETTTPSQASSPYVSSGGTGKWRIIPPTTQHRTVNETTLPAEDAALYRIEHVEDLTQLSPATSRPTEQSQQHPSAITKPTPPDNDMRSDSQEMNENFANVINAWQQSSPTSGTQSHDALFSNQEIQILRSQVGLDPIHEHIPGNAKHPNHHFTWNTRKLMCRRIHNPGLVLPSLPSPTPGQPANMAEYANDFFIGSPYTNEPSAPECCAACGSLCCRYAELSSHPQKRTTDIMELNKICRNAEAVATLRTTKPNGVEEWDAFLVCSHCQRAFCPDCITLCSEALCQEPVCSDCRQGLELCRIHNVI